MKYFFGLLCTFLVTLYLSIDFVSANWLPTDTLCTQYNATTINTWSITVPKLEGIWQYCAKQELLENPYSGSTITFNGSAYVIRYPNGVTTTELNIPNQAQFLGKYVIKSKIYKFDKTPTNNCSSGDGILYFGSLPASTPLVAYTWGWTNQNIFWRVSCTDWTPTSLIKTNSWDIINIGGYNISGSNIYSGSQYMTWYSILVSSSIDISQCVKSFHDTNVSHGASSVILNLQDNAWNTNVNDCPYNHTVLKDASPPIVTVKDEYWLGLDDITDPWFQSGTRLATDSTQFRVTIQDDVYWWSAVSGIKNYSATVYQTNDYLWNTIPNVSICNVPITTFPELVDPTNAYNVANIRMFDIICNSSPSFRKTWTYHIDVRAEDHAGNIVNFQNIMIVYPHPDIHIVNNPTIPIPGPVNSDGIASHTFKAKILDKFDNPIYNHPVNNIIYTGSANIYLNEIDQTGVAITVKNANPSFTSPTGILSVEIVSIAPGELSTGFGFNINSWTDVDSYRNHSWSPINYGFWDDSEFRKFLRPYTSELLLDPIKIILWYVHSGSLIITPMNFAPSSYTVHNFSDSMGTIDPNMTLSSISEFSPLWVLFTPEQIGSNILDFRIKTHPYASYNMNGIPILAYITPDAADIWSTYTNQMSSTGSVNRIYVIWNTQTKGKDNYVSTLSDISSISNIAVKNNIRKNAIIAVRNRIPDTAINTNPMIVSGIKYIQWDYTITDTEAISRNWETLIVIDGNITMETNMFNTGWKMAAIMVMKSDQNSDKWNLFIKPNVRFLSSLIYTDGSIESVNSSGNRFTSMSKDRSNQLSNQLVLKWLFISRNTIGWAVLWSITSGAWGKKYTLPGNIWTDDLFTAASYDLSFLRSSNIGYDWVTQPYNFNNDAFTVVIYDGKYLLTPPPGFNTRL